MEVTLSQAGADCTVSATGGQYLPRSGREALLELAEELDRGVTPVITYWSSAFMGWMDGPGEDQEGPCRKGADDPSKCPSTVKFGNFRVLDHLPRTAPSQMVNVHLNKL